MGTYDFPNLMGDSIIDINNINRGNEPIALSSWLQSYTRYQPLQPNLDIAIRAIKDIWFDFPDGVIPEWFNTKKAVLRSISNSRFGMSNVFRVAFISETDTSFDDLYSIDYSNGFADNGVLQLRAEKVIEGTKTGVNFIVDQNALLEFTRSNGNVITSAEGLRLKAYINKKTTSPIYSVGRLPRGGNVKTFLTGSLTSEDFIIVDTVRLTITIPSTARIITKTGAIKNLVAGVYTIPFASGFIFVNIDTGDVTVKAYDVMSQLANQIYWDENKYICLGITSPHLKDATLIGEKWKVDGKVKGIVSDNIPQIANNTIVRKDISEPLKIVFFGSSWFMNTWWYLNKIIKSAGINAELTGFFVGGASFSTWNGFWDNDTVSDCWTSTNGSDWVQSTAPFKTTLLNKWDIVAFQQGAWQSRTWDAYSNHWSSLVSHVKESCGIDTVIAFNSTWTPAINGELSPYPNTVDGQKQWQQDSYNMTKRFMSLSGIYNVSPCGAAMWAMRRNSQLNLGNDLATDHLHPDAGLPMYALSGVFFETYISPMYGVSFNAVNWLPDANTQQSPASANAYQPIDTTQRDIIRKIIKLAISDRFGFSSAPSNNIATESGDIPVPSIKNVAISQADYNSLSVKDPNTIYYVY